MSKAESGYQVWMNDGEESFPLGPVYVSHKTAVKAYYRLLRTFRGWPFAIIWIENLEKTEGQLMLQLDFEYRESADVVILCLQSNEENVPAWCTLDTQQRLCLR